VCSGGEVERGVDRRAVPLTDTELKVDGSSAASGRWYPENNPTKIT